MLRHLTGISRYQIDALKEQSEGILRVIVHPGFSLLESWLLLPEDKQEGKYVYNQMLENKLGGISEIYKAKNALGGEPDNGDKFCSLDSYKNLMTELIAYLDIMDYYSNQASAMPFLAREGIASVILVPNPNSGAGKALSRVSHKYIEHAAGGEGLLFYINTETAGNGFLGFPNVPYDPDKAEEYKKTRKLTDEGKRMKLFLEDAGISELHIGGEYLDKCVNNFSKDVAQFFPDQKYETKVLSTASALRKWKEWMRDAFDFGWKLDSVEQEKKKELKKLYQSARNIFLEKQFSLDAGKGLDCNVAKTLEEHTGMIDFARKAKLYFADAVQKPVLAKIIDEC